MRLPGIGSHHSAKAITDEWLTPPHVTNALGVFDLDPCTITSAGSVSGNWIGARTFFTIGDDGLDHDWAGRVWLNPPYSEVEAWMAKMARHGFGTALVFARTETRWWFDSVWRDAHALMFLRGRLTFHRGDGQRSKAGHNSGGPSVLVAYGVADALALEHSGLDGHLVRNA